MTIFLFSFCFFGGVAFSEYFFVPLPFSLCMGKCVVRFPLPGGVFLPPCGHGLDLFYILLCKNSNQSINQVGRTCILRALGLLKKPRPFVQSFFVLRYACGLIATRSYNSCQQLHCLVPSPSETWFRGMSVGGSFRRE